MYSSDSFSSSSFDPSFIGNIQWKFPSPAWPKQGPTTPNELISLIVSSITLANFDIGTHESVNTAVVQPLRYAIDA